MVNNEISAGKIVPKSLLVKQHQREKMAQEITLHKTLQHKYVVKLFSFFEDSNFVYIILELCRRRSLMEVKLITCFHDSWIYKFLFTKLSLFCFPYKVQVFYWDQKWRYNCLS